MIVGIDARPALFGRTGFARATRETIGALAQRADVELRAFGAAWRRPRPGAESAIPNLVRRRWPARLQALAAAAGYGVESLLGPLDVYQHTDVVFAPVRRTPEVLTVYDLTFLREPRWFAPGFASRLLPRLAARAAAAAMVVVPSARVADEVLRAGLVPAVRLRVVPLGADHVDPRPLPDDEARVRRALQAAGLVLLEGEALVVVPGTREPRKNQLALVRAFLRAGGSARMLLVGAAGWGCRELEELLASPRRDGRVGSAGEVDDADLAALLRRADVVAYPSLAEGFGLPVAEAMRCGRAVLTGLGTPMADFGGEAVLAVDARDEHALAEGLRRLLGDRGLAAEMGARAALRAAELTWERTAAELVEVYRGALR